MGSSGENNCWINCVLRALSVMVEWIPNYSYQSQVAMINALINYVKDMTYINNGRTLEVNSRDIHLEPNSQPLSVKELFSTMIRNNDFNSDRQQDAGEGLLLILQFIQALGSTEMNFINPFRFCNFYWRETKRCLKCREVEDLPISEGNILSVGAPETGHFDMNQAVTSKLQEENERNIHCGNCGNIGVNYRTQYIGTQKVMIIQVNFIDDYGRKLNSKCIPLQNLDININGQTKKYEIHYIIEHIGPNLHSGHYISYFKKNNTWYCANDKIITRIETQELPSQPYINIYKEAHSVSQSTVEPLDVQDIDLQENINKEKNESYNRNVISHCDDCDKQVTHICKKDAENVATFGPLSTEENNLPGNKHRQDKPNEENVLACGDNCDNQLTHVCQFDNVNDCTNKDFDTVLETFYQKTDQRNGVSDIIAEQILTQEQPNYNRRVVVAPTEKGKFVNHGEVKDIEERCFPHLFPKGNGGYISTYASKKVTFSNYIKMRLNGIDRRYANDHQYIIFLYQIKESLEIKRSRVTYFRKCKMNKKKSNKDTLGALTKTEIERSDLGFKALRKVRGTTPYFEAKKKDLIAMIRQIGPPHTHPIHTHTHS